MPQLGWFARTKSAKFFETNGRFNWINSKTKVPTLDQEWKLGFQTTWWSLQVSAQKRLSKMSMTLSSRISCCQHVHSFCLKLLPKECWVHLAAAWFKWNWCLLAHSTSAGATCQQQREKTVRSWTWPHLNSTLLLSDYLIWFKFNCVLCHNRLRSCLVGWSTEMPAIWRLKAKLS